MESNNKDYINLKAGDKDFIVKLNDQKNTQVGFYASIILGYENSIFTKNFLIFCVEEK